VVIAACYALAGHSQASVAVDSLILLSGDERAEVAVAAVHALGRLAAPTDRLDFASRRRARSRLVELAGSPSAEIRSMVAHGLAIPGGTGEADALIALTNDADPLVRINAVRSFSFPGSPIDPDLRRTLDDSDGRVVLATLQGLTKMRGQDVVDTLVDVIVHDDRMWLRERAVSALRAVDPDQAVGLANGLSRSDHVRIRLAVAGLLLGRRDENALEYAGRLLADSDPSVRRAAIPAMAGAAGPLADALGEWTEATDPADRAAVARAAGWRLADKSRSAEDREEAFRILERLWRESEGELDVELLGEVLGAAARGGSDPQTRELLETALGCSDRRIRLRAIEQLRALFGEDHSDAAGSAAELPLGHYLEIARWARLPRAAIVTIERPGFVPGRFTVKLNTRDAALTCWNFVQLAEQGYYRGLKIRRVVPDARVEFGDRASDERARPSQAIRDELLPHWFGPGTLVMNSAERDSAEAEWFVTLTTQPQLVGSHTPFGRVVQNFPGVAALLLPDDILVSVAAYEGDGGEPLPRLGARPPAAIEQSD
jgi:cyclophilin family peptidyl-prolyl cis-trans isomerase/HEAT repeat protein